MHEWLLRGVDPFVFGDGRSQSGLGGTTLSLVMPRPSTVAGAMRTRAGEDDKGRFDMGAIERVKGYQIAGPWLVRIGDAGCLDPLFPAPADAVVFPGDSSPTQRVAIPVRPLELPPGVATSKSDVWAPVGFRRPNPSKPARHSPMHWSWEADLLPWLCSADGESRELDPLRTCSSNFGAENRTHVSIDPVFGVAREGHLYAELGYRLADDVAFAVRTNAPLDEGLGPLGGQQRLVEWCRASKNIFPALPEAVRESAREGALRLMLVTPGQFSEGLRPGSWSTEKVSVTIVAVSHARAESVSGWSYEHHGPKRICRTVPAGAVYFIRLQGSPDARVAWAERMWGRCVSDEATARRDGFGLCVLGAWSGNLAKMNVDGGAE